jgi:hypothetical protein
MKLFVVTSGSYSDYGINGIFSSQELAEAHIKRLQVFGENEQRFYEAELDEIRVPKYVTFEYNAKSKKYTLERDNWCWGEDCEGLDIGDEIITIRVKYNENKDVMLKSARDNYMAWKARELGI